MTGSDRDYFSRRVEVELARAQNATCLAAARAHAELAEQYRAKLVAIAGPATVVDIATLSRVSLAEDQARQQAEQGKPATGRGTGFPFLRN